MNPIGKSWRGREREKNIGIEKDRKRQASLRGEDENERTRKESREESGSLLIKRSRRFVTEPNTPFAYPYRCFARCFMFDARAMAITVIPQASRIWRLETITRTRFLARESIIRVRIVRGEALRNYLRVWRARLRLVRGGL